LGVVLAVFLCVGVAVVYRAVDRSLPHDGQETLAALMALLAVAGVTYMIVWMRRHSRGLKRSLETNAENALLEGSTWALVGLAFFAVIREGLETAVFLLAAFENSVNPRATGTGAVLGVGVAVALGYGIYRGGVRINLSRFFRITGFVLVIVAAGLLSYAIHDLAEARVIEVAQGTALNLTWLMRPGSLQEALLSGALGIRAIPTHAEAFAWLAYAIPMGLYILWPQRRVQPPVRVEAAAPAAS
jgi:high-affinity iron transporter